MYPPPGFKSFDPTGIISTPVINTETTVLILPIPIGWDGIILRIANVFIGPGFVDGSGDLTWRILVDNLNPVDNYGAILTTIGTYSLGGYGITPREISGIIVRSGQNIYYTVTNTNAALIPGTQVACIFGGYFWRVQGGTY